IAPGALGPPEKKKTLPIDRALAFSQLARQKLNNGLVRCEERYPLQGAHSVLVTVVDRDAGVWREHLAPLHQELFGKENSDPLAPVKLEVIDRATDEALQRLIESGLLMPATRATRQLCAASDAGAAAVALSEEERQKASAHRTQA